MSRQLLCKTEGRRPEPLGGSGGMLPRKDFQNLSLLGVHFPAMWERNPYFIFYILLIPNLIYSKKEWYSGPTGRICSFHYIAIATSNTAFVQGLES